MRPHRPRRRSRVEDRMRTPETNTLFAANILATERLDARSPGFLADGMTWTLSTQAAYDQRFADFLTQVRRACNPAYVRELLLRLGGPGCRFGTDQFASCERALERMGVTGAAMIFEHDRHWVVEHCGKGNGG